MIVSLVKRLENDYGRQLLRAQGYHLDGARLMATAQNVLQAAERSIVDGFSTVPRSAG
jgi:hypothetical protein